MVEHSGRRSTGRTVDVPSIARSKPFAHSRQAAFCFGVKNVTVPNQLEREAIELLIAAYREVRNAQKLYVLVKRDLDPTRYSISVHSLTGYNGVGKGAAHVLKAKGWANLRSDNLDIDDVFCLTADGLIAGAKYEAECGPFVFYEDDEELAAIDQAIAHGLAAADELLGEGWDSGPEWGKAPLDVAAGPEEAEPGYEPVRNRQRLRIDWKAAEEAWKNEQFEKGFRELEWLIWSKQAARRSITSQTMNPDQYEGPNAVTQSSPMAPPAGGGELGPMNGGPGPKPRGREEREENREDEAIRLARIANEYSERGAGRIKPTSIPIWEKIVELKRIPLSHQIIAERLSIPLATFNYHWYKMKKTGYWQDNQLD